MLIGGFGGVITAGARRAGRQGIAVLLCGQVAAIVVATLHGHAAILLGTHGGLRSDVGGKLVKLGVNIGRAHSRLLVGDGVEIAVQGGLSGVDTRLRVNDGLVGIDRGTGLDRSGSRGRGSGGTGLSGKLAHVDRQGDTREGANLVLPGVRTLRVARTGQPGHVVRVVSIESCAVETVGRGRVARRMEARNRGRTAGDRVELLGAIHAGTLAVPSDMHTHTDNVVLGEHVLVVTRGVLPLIEEGISGLHGVLGRAVGPPLVAVVFKVVVGDVLASVARFASVERHAVPVLEDRIMVKVVSVGHVLAPPTRVGGQRVRHDQLRQARVGTVGVHLLNDEGLNDLSLGVIVNL